MAQGLNISTPTPKEPKDNLFLFILVIAIITVFLTFVTVYTLKKAANSKKPSVEKGEEFFKSGEYKRALVNYYKLSKIKEKREEGKIGIAKSLISIAWDKYNKDNWRKYAKDKDDYMPSKELEKAINILKDLIYQRQSNYKAHYYLGIIYSEKGWFYRAIREYEKVLEYKDDYWDAYNNIGYCYLQMNEIDHAEMWFKKIIQKNSDYDRAYLNLAVLYLTEKDDLKLGQKYAKIWSKRHPRGIFTYHLKKEIERIKEDRQMEKWP